MYNDQTIFYQPNSMHSATKNDDRTEENAWQGQTANICRMILPHTLFKINRWLSTAGQRLTLSQTTDFSLFQTEGVCRRQFKI